MKTIPSFTIDHNRLLRGIYVSRKDEVGGETVTTFDIRMKEPNREPVMSQEAMHTIEHLAQERSGVGGQDCLLGSYGMSHGIIPADEGRPAKL